MDLRKVLSSLGEESHLDAVSPHWKESVESFPKGLPSFLQPSEISENRKAGLLAEYMEPPIQEAAKRIAGNPNLLHLIWHAYRLVYYHTDYWGFDKWPTFEKALGKELCGIFYLLVGMAMVPKVRAVHKKKNIDPQITRDTLSDIRCFNYRYRKGHDGHLGLVKNEVWWYRHHCAGELFRLGRLQFYIHGLDGHVEVYRNRKTREVLAMPENGMKMRPDGYCLFEDDDPEAQGNWIGKHVIDKKNNTVTGHVISPKGMTLQQTVTLDLEDWEHIVTKGTGMLSMHIPLGEPMPLKQCIESIRRAYEFFSKIYPDRPFVGVDCYSWIFGNQLEDILEPDSNLVQFIRAGYLYPIPGVRTEGYFFIFYKTEGDIKDYPVETDFQRKIFDWITAGKPWRGSGWFVLKEDIDRLSEQYYRSQWPPKGLDIQDK